MFKKILSIHGTPRTGTTWLGQIVNSSEHTRYKLQPLFSHAFKDRISLNSTAIDMRTYFEELYVKEDEFLDQKIYSGNEMSPVFKAKMQNPECLVTKMNRYHFLIPHFLKLMDDVNIVCIIRNPLATLVSFKNAPKEFDPRLDFNDEWYFAQTKNEFRPENYFGFAKWKEFAKLCHTMKALYPDRVYIIRYEDLCNAPVRETEKLFSWCGLQMTDMTIAFLNESTTKLVEGTYSVFRGEKDIHDWVGQLDESIITKVQQELSGTEMERYLED